LGIRLGKAQDPLLHRRGVLTQHVQALIEGHHLDLHRFSEFRVVARHVGRHIEHGVHLLRVLVGDLQRQAMDLTRHRRAHGRHYHPQRHQQRTRKNPRPSAHVVLPSCYPALRNGASPPPDAGCMQDLYILKLLVRTEKAAPGRPTGRMI